MKRVLLLIFLFTGQLFSCALCSMYTPSAHVSVHLDINATTIKQAHLSWKFSKEFVDTLIPQYDKNKNKKFDEDELVLIEKAFTDYIEPVDFLTTMKYYSKYYDGTFEDVNKSRIDVSSYKTYQKGNELFFDYTLVLNFPLRKEMILFFSISDEGDYMNFILKPEGISFDTPKGYQIIENANFDMVFIEIADENALMLSDKESNLSVEKEPVEVLQKSAFILYLSGILAQTTDKIRSYLLEIKYQGSVVAFFSLMLFSFVYGIIHAIGPGHGKSLVGSYFLSTNRDIKKAFIISLLIGVVHTFSALILTLIVYFVLNTFLSTFLDDVTFYLTKVSAIIIVFIALYLLYKKLPKKPVKIASWTSHQSSCGCSSCHSSHQKEDLALVVSAGIIPCPTTVLVFIFTISLGMYTVGFISALVMSLGMSLVIFVAAALSVKVRQTTEEKFSWISNFMSFASIIIILILGIFMFFI